MCLVHLDTLNGTRIARIEQILMFYTYNPHDPCPIIFKRSQHEGGPHSNRRYNL